MDIAFYRPVFHERLLSTAMNSVQDKTTKTSINHPEKQLLKTNVLDTSLSHISHSSGHVYTFQGQLHYHGRIFRKGDHFTIVDANAVRYNAKLLTANESEVLLHAYVEMDLPH